MTSPAPSLPAGPRLHTAGAGLVWYSQKALNDAILKTYEGHQSLKACTLMQT